MIPTLKVYEVDYDFLISNYLDKSLWSKSWNLYVYRDMVFTLRLNAIDCVNETICFKIKCNKCENWDSEYVYYPINGDMTIPILKNKINGAIWQLMLTYEQYLIRDSDEYRHISNKKSEEECYLREVAEDYLDDNGVTNDDIREPYIDKYIADHSSVDDLLTQYVAQSRYKVIPTTLLIFAKSIDDENRFNKVVESNTYNNIGKILEEVDEIMDAWNEDHFEETRATFYDYCEAI